MASGAVVLAALTSAQGAATIAGIGAVIGAFGAIQQGRFAAAAAEREALAAEEQATQAKLAAAQQEALRLEQLRKIKGTQLAQAAALGFDPFSSRSFLALRTESERLAGRDIENIRLTGLLNQRRFILSADASRTEAGAATSGAAFSAVGKLFGGAKSALAQLKIKPGPDIAPSTSALPSTGRAL